MFDGLSDNPKAGHHLTKGTMECASWLALGADSKAVLIHVFAEGNDEALSRVPGEFSTPFQVSEEFLVARDSVCVYVLLAAQCLFRFLHVSHVTEGGAQV